MPQLFQVPRVPYGEGAATQAGTVFRGWESLLFFTRIFFQHQGQDAVWTQYSRKAYCSDTGIYYAITGKTDWGRLFENIALLELRRKAQGLQEICYWKNRQGLEVDFVVMEGTRIQEAIQVVYSLEDEGTRKREVRSLFACKAELRPHVTYVLTREVSEMKTYEGNEITFIPLIDWLMKS